MSSNLEPIYIAIIGTGGVGSALITQLATLQKTYTHLRVVLITRSKSSITANPINGTPLSLTTWSSDLSKSTQNGLSPDETIDYLRTGNPSRSIVIDNTASQMIADAYPTFLSAGSSIVTPNKKAFSGSQSLWDSIHSHSTHPIKSVPSSLAYHESSVGAGIPVISTLKDLIESGDNVKRIEGVISGSLSYLFNSFMPLSPSSGDDSSKSWSAWVSQAKELGYTEPDPRDDLSGLDVARKLVILARVAGLKLDKGTESFPIQSLIPSTLESCRDGDEFLARLPEFDGEMEKMRDEARREGKVVRYVGSVDFARGECKVAMERVDEGSPLAGLKGSANVFSFYTERYGDDPLVIQGAGAGGEITAMGVTTDLIKVVQRLGWGKS